MSSIWISNTNKSHLFGCVWALSCEKEGGRHGAKDLGTIKSKYWWNGASPCDAAAKDSFSLATQTFLFMKRECMKNHAFFQHCLQSRTITGCRWRTTTSFPVLVTELLQMNRWGPVLKACWWRFMRVSYSDFLTQILKIILGICFRPPVTAASHLINITGYTGFVLCCYRWIFCLTASTE